MAFGSDWVGVGEVLLNTSAVACIIVYPNTNVFQWFSLKGCFWEVTFAAQLENCKAGA